MSFKKQLSYFIIATSFIAMPMANADQAAIEKKPLDEKVDVISDKQELMDRLTKIKQFSASFSQVVSSEGGTVVQESKGQLAVKKPNLVYWHTGQPEETLIVSDGSTLWFYDPFIEQVTAYAVDNAIVNTPILLLTSSDPLLWASYDVVKSSEEVFLINNKIAESRILSLKLNFDKDNKQLKTFTFVDNTGQQSVVELNNVESNKDIEAARFAFKVPEGVYLDDQR